MVPDHFYDNRIFRLPEIVLFLIFFGTQMILLTDIHGDYTNLICHIGPI